MNAFRKFANAFRFGAASNPSFEAAGHGRRLKGFNPPKRHINAAIQAAGPTLVSRVRWLYDNESMCGNAIDEWVSASVGDGIKPRPRTKNKKAKRALIDLFWRWTEEADADGMSDYYGIQERVAREVRLTGECFVRIRSRRPGDMWTVPFQLQLLPSEMLDVAYNGNGNGGNIIRAGIEYDAIRRRVAYHFWRFHPYDDVPAQAGGLMRDRVRVPAEEVIHVIEAKQAGQIRGVPSIARVLVKIFKMEIYDDAELERKSTAALFTAFLVGRGDNPIANDDDIDGADDEPVAPMQPGAIIDLGDDKDVKFATPADVGGSYEPFQYRNALKIAAGTGVPYAYVTGDMTKGNFSNVRTDIIRFRRRVNQWNYNTLIFQLCRMVWMQFVDRAYMAGLVDLPGYDEDPTQYWAADHLAPRQEWIDPAKDIKAELEAIGGGLKSRTQSVAERGYDREDLDAEIDEERKEEDRLGLEFSTRAKATPGPVPGAEPDPDQDEDEKEEAEDDA
ncbi:phage portal protein [Neorhizobium sp. T786]|uniref:phage portal protein n=1 Tax=Pseudorhizobium xiangyangii TaxID=2883104 RepID=UPI001CFF927B|nr:phage portal protein [Neorhizobium xiangyangii]MCB5201712.1 phage portal protein [Neorhizobium xiangyangii]